MTGRQETFLQRRLKQRRKELRLSQPALATEAGIEVGPIQRLEQGQTDVIQPHNERRLGPALRWEDGWLQKLRDGQEPEERVEQIVDLTLPAQLQSMMSLARELEEPMKQRALNAALRAFVAETAANAG